MTQIIEHIPAPPARFYFREQRRKEHERDAREAIGAERAEAARPKTEWESFTAAAARAEAKRRRARVWGMMSEAVHRYPAGTVFVWAE